jgi:hypothetical protein
MTASATSAPNPFSGLSLRCNSCGAPYEKAGSQEILTCTYCGTTQRVVDARQFLDYFTTQVTAFVRQAVPPGLDVSRSSTVDPIARLSAFNMSVRPRLTTESEQYRFALFNLLSRPCLVLPFTATNDPPSQVSPAGISVFVAKVQSVSGLAVDDASRELLSRASGLASAYQSMLVATELLRGTKPERFHLASQNFATAASALESVPKWRPLATRLSGLSRQARASDLLIAGTSTGDTRPMLGAAGRQLSESGTQLAGTPELGFMTTAVEQELSAVRTLGSMVSIVETSANVAPHPFAFLDRLCRVLDWCSRYTPADWAPDFRSMRLWEAVFAQSAELRTAQSGRGSVRFLQVGTGVLIPFWRVELPYTFETGVLWAKRGKEVPETLLVAATFPTDLASFAGMGPARVLTDVFASGQGVPQLGQVYNRLAGREQRISESRGLADVLQGTADASIAGQPAAPPLTTGTEALKLVQNYLGAIRAANPKVGAQLRASSPRVVEMVYLPCTVPGPVPLAWLGPLSPKSVGDEQSILSFVA